METREFISNLIRAKFDSLPDFEFDESIKCIKAMFEIGYYKKATQMIDDMAVDLPGSQQDNLIKIKSNI